MQRLHEVQEEFVSTVNHLAEVQVQVVHLPVQLLEQIVLSVDQEWCADRVNMDLFMGAASTHTARENVKEGESNGYIQKK